MNQAMQWDRRSIIASLPARIGILFAVMVAIAVVAVAVGVGVFGTRVFEAVVAWLVCTIASMFAHVGSEYPRGDLNFASRLAMQMMVRTAPPFLAAVWAINFAAPPLEKSLVFYMILFYLVGLIAEVQLNLAKLNGNGEQEQRRKLHAASRNPSRNL